MKRIALAVALMIGVGTAQAQTPHQFCTGMANLARTTMMHRQLGTPYEEVADAISEQMKEPMIKAIVDYTYTKDIEVDPVVKRIVVDEYREDIYNGCMDARRVKGLEI